MVGEEAGLETGMAGGCLEGVSELGSKGAVWTEWNCVLDNDMDLVESGV